MGVVIIQYVEVLCTENLCVSVASSSVQPNWHQTWYFGPEYAREIVLKKTHYLAKQTQNSVFEKNDYDNIFFENRPLRFGIKPITVPRNVSDTFFYFENILQNPVLCKLLVLSSKTPKR